MKLISSFLVAASLFLASATAINCGGKNCVTASDGTTTCSNDCTATAPECVDGYICDTQSNQCTPGSCPNDCGAGYACTVNAGQYQCMPSSSPSTCSTTTPECADGYICDTQNNQCTPGSCPNDCGAGYACTVNAGQYQCMPGATNACLGGCPAGQTCNNGTCKNDSCAGVTCSTGETCENGICKADPSANSIFWHNGYNQGTGVTVTSNNPNPIDIDLTLYGETFSPKDGRVGVVGAKFTGDQVILEVTGPRIGYWVAGRNTEIYALLGTTATSAQVAQSLIGWYNAGQPSGGQSCSTNNQCSEGYACMQGACSFLFEDWGGVQGGTVGQPFNGGPTASAFFFAVDMTDGSPLGF